MPRQRKATPIERAAPTAGLGGGRPHSRVDVVGLGLNAMDSIAVLPSFPLPLTKTRILEYRREPGGQVATALTTCARLGLTTRYIGSVGSDPIGREQLESLRREGIDESHVRVVEGAGSQMAIILVEKGVGERTVLWDRDPRLTYPPEEVDEHVIRSGRLLHLDGHDTAAALRAATLANAAGVRVVIDIDRVYDDSTFELLGKVDFLIAAEELAVAVTGESDPHRAASALAARFPQALTGVTLGARGAVFVLDGVAEASPAFRVDVRDTTGAGDVFHGAFIYGLVQDWNIRKTIRFAHAVAAMKCTALGARTAIPHLDAALAFLAERSPADA